MKLGTQSNSTKRGVHGAGIEGAAEWHMTGFVVSKSLRLKSRRCKAIALPLRRRSIWNDLNRTQNWNASLISENYWDMQFPVECIAWRQLLKTTHRQGKKINGKESFCCFAEPDVAWLIQAFPGSLSLNIKAVSIDLKQVKCDTPWASIGEGVSHNELRRPVYLHLLHPFTALMCEYDMKYLWFWIMLVVLFSERLSVHSLGGICSKGCEEMEKNFLRIALLAMNLLYQLIWKVCCWLSVKRIVKVFKWSSRFSAWKWFGGISEAQISILHISMLHVHHVIRFCSVFQGMHHFTAMQWPDSTGAMQLSLTCFGVQQLFFSTFVQKFVQKIRVDDRRAHYSCDAGLWNSHGCVSMHLSREFKSFQFGTKTPIVRYH